MKTFRASRAMLATALLLICLLGSARAIGTKRPATKKPATLIIRFVHIFDKRSPYQIQAEGGWQPPHRDYGDNMRAFYINHHILGEFDEQNRSREANWRTAYVTAYSNLEELERRFGEQEGYFYQIHATGNMFVPESETEFRVYALGGIHWSQVKKYRHTYSTNYREEPSYDPGYNYFTCLRLTAGSSLLLDSAHWDCAYASNFAHEILRALGPRVGYNGVLPLCFRPLGNVNAVTTSTTPATAGIVLPECQPGPSGLQNSHRQLGQNGHREAPGSTLTHFLSDRPGHDSGDGQQCAAPQASNPGICCNREQEQRDLDWLDSHIQSSFTRLGPLQYWLYHSRPDNNEAGQSTGVEPVSDEEEPTNKKQKVDDHTSPTYETSEEARARHTATIKKLTQVTATPSPAQLPAPDLDFDDIDFTYLAVIAATCGFSSANKGFHQKRSEYEFYSKKDCDDANKAIQKLDRCERIHHLEAGFDLSTDYWSGSNSEISLAFDGPDGLVRVPIADSPPRGFQTWKPFNITKSGISNVKDIKSLKLDTRERGSSWYNGWKLQDVELRARCVESNDSMSLNKYKSLNEWFPSVHNKDWQDVGVLPVKETDWVMKPPCNFLSRLSLNFTIGDKYLAGTDDTIAFYVRPMSKPITIAKAPSRGKFVHKELDLSEHFGAEVIQVKNLTEMVLLDAASAGFSWAPDWFLHGVTLSGHCVGSGKLIEMNKFKSIDQWEGHGNKVAELEQAWSGEFRPEDWS
ncbi:hypothetical protein CP533_5941 [Ophiocordyceps camponoti-saundersi (nom. inval.)]|nr:hypothetical protein CP533_5941 [Ophiocordyceps camponoti-saundersi (nom. inval.)]